MDEENILNGGAEVAYEIKERLLELDGLKNDSASLNKYIAELTKEIAQRTKDENAEVNATVTKRRNELTASMDKSLADAQQRLKKARAERAENKNSLVAQRIENETKSYHEEIRTIKEEIRGIFQKNEISQIFNNRPFFTLFFPEGIAEYAIVLLTVLVIAVLPALLFILFTSPETRHVWVIVLIYILLFAIVVGCSFLIIRMSRSDEKRLKFREAKKKYQKIAEVKGKITKKSKEIRNDKDESGYELGEHDEKIKNIDAEIDRILEETKKANEDFENRKKIDITNEIHGRYAEEIDQKKLACEDAKKELTETDADLNRLIIEISKKYESYIGKEYLNVTMMDTFIDYMNNDVASTIGEAIEYYKSQSTIT